MTLIKALEMIARECSHDPILDTDAFKACGASKQTHDHDRVITGFEFAGPLYLNGITLLIQHRLLIPAIK